MRRDVTWTERLPDRIKREVSVSFFGGKLFWHERLSTEEKWNDGMVPTEDDWERLYEEVDKRVQRRRSTLEDLDIVRKRLIGVRRGRSRQQGPGKEW